MTLKDKINKIDNPPIADFASGHNDTIKEFFNTFIKPILPQEPVIRKWHELLMEYTDDKNFSGISCCVRYGNNGSKTASAHGETGYYKLRRGWLTKNTNDNFEYFFADNFFSTFIYKMALDGFCPDINEFTDAFRNHYFPYGFGYKIDNRINEYRGVVIVTAKQPGFLGKYKLSHVFDSGNNFIINGKKYTGRGVDKRLSQLYYDIGHSNDYLKNPDNVRRMLINYDMKKVIVAKFLRFAHPFNYFLTPSKERHTCGIYVYKKDIGEDPRMISYMKSYLKKTYPKEYGEFLKKILWYEDPTSLKEDGTTKIDINYFDSPIPKGTIPLYKVKMVYEFLTNKKTTYNKLDIMLGSPAANHGARSYNIVKDFKDKKGILATNNIDDEISIATGKYKDYLLRIKEEYGI